MMDAALPGVVSWGWAGRALEDESGDLHAVVAYAGNALVALIDGLGHGAHAARAARIAARVLEAHAAEPIAVVVQRCHDALHGTRGVVMSLAAFCCADSSMTWLGVGNVDAILCTSRRNDALVVRGGVVGYQLPALRPRSLTVAPGDTLILTTDGIASGFTVDLELAYSPQEIAESILARFAKATDDAHVVVARYLGDRA